MVQGAPRQGRGSSDRAPQGWDHARGLPAAGTREGVAHPASDPPPGAQGPVPCGHWSAGGLSARYRGRWVVLHPVYPPDIPTRIPVLGPYTARCPSPRCTSTPVRGSPETCTYDRFETRVGEPRGVEHGPLFRSRTGYIQLYRFTRPFDWFQDPFSTCFTEFRVPVTEVRTRFTEFRVPVTEFRTRFTELLTVSTTSCLYASATSNVPSF